jgi:hypothetical protein
MEGKDNAMFRKSIIALAAAATLGVAALASSPASAFHVGHMGGFHRMGAFHQTRAFPHVAFRQRVFARRVAFRHPIYVRHHFALMRAPILLSTSCWRIHWVRIHRHWQRRRVWVCG